MFLRVLINRFVYNVQIYIHVVHLELEGNAGLWQLMLEHVAFDLEFCASIPAIFLSSSPFVKGGRGIT